MYIILGHPDVLLFILQKYSQISCSLGFQLFVVSTPAFQPISISKYIISCDETCARLLKFTSNLNLTKYTQQQQQQQQKHK